MQGAINYEELRTLIVEDDLEFYERHLINLSDEEMKVFYENNPDFMQEYNMYEGRLELLRSETYRGILKKIYRKQEMPL